MCVCLCVCARTPVGPAECCFPPITLPPSALWRPPSRRTSLSGRPRSSRPRRRMRTLRRDNSHRVASGRCRGRPPGTAHQQCARSASTGPGQATRSHGRDRRLGMPRRSRTRALSLITHDSDSNSVRVRLSRRHVRENLKTHLDSSIHMYVCASRVVLTCSSRAGTPSQAYLAP